MIYLRLEWHFHHTNDNRIFNHKRCIEKLLMVKPGFGQIELFNDILLRNHKLSMKSIDVHLLGIILSSEWVLKYSL